MIPLLIFVLSVSALAQFFIAYCRSLLRMYGKVELSDPGRRLAGLDGNGLEAAAFPRIMRMVREYPDPADDGAEVVSIRVYYVLLRVLCMACGVWPALRYWVAAEREDCAHFAAVALDRRVTATAKDIT
jgi:hypothetical protein